MKVDKGARIKENILSGAAKNLQRSRMYDKDRRKQEKSE